MIRAMNEPDNALPGFFFAPDSQNEPIPVPDPDQTAPAEPAAQTADEPTEPAAWTSPVVQQARVADPAPAPSPAVPPATSDAAAISGAMTAESAAAADESFSVVNPDGSTTIRLPDGSYQTIATLPGGATIVTSTQPPGAAPTSAPSQPRGRRWRRGDR
jgi:hypothetical protein